MPNRKRRASLETRNINNGTLLAEQLNTLDTGCVFLIVSVNEIPGGQKMY